MTTRKARLESERSKRNYPPGNTTSGYMAVTCLAIVALIALIGIMGGWITIVDSATTAPVKVAPPVTTATIERIRPIIRQEIERSRDTTPAWMPKVERPLRERLLVWKDVNRGGNWIARIDRRLEGTPMEGQGRAFYVAAVDAGLPPNLSVAIALHESGAGRYTPPGSHNPYGMTGPTSSDFWDVPGKGPDGTRMYQAYPDWETAIRYHAAFIARTWPGADGPEDLRGYAVSSAWLGGVRGQMARI